MFLFQLLSQNKNTYFTLFYYKILNPCLEELWDIEEDREDEDGEAVLDQPLGVAGNVLDDGIVVNGLMCGQQQAVNILPRNGMIKDRKID